MKSTKIYVSNKICCVHSDQDSDITIKLSTSWICCSQILHFKQAFRTGKLVRNITLWSMDPLSPQLNGMTEFFFSGFWALVIDIYTVNPTSNSVWGFEDCHITEARFEESRGCSQARGPGSDYDNFGLTVTHISKISIWILKCYRLRRNAENSLSISTAEKGWNESSQIFFQSPQPSNTCKKL